MPKVKIPRKSTAIDMTAMCDVAFLLLTFFMLTTKFKPDEPVVVDTPYSIQDKLIPETGILHILIDKQNRVYFGVDGNNVRYETIKKLNDLWKLGLSEDEMKAFSLVETIGLDKSKVKEYLSTNDPVVRKELNTGIPYEDSTNNQLKDWIYQARLANGELTDYKPDLALKIAIKGDQESNYPAIKKVIGTLQDQNVNRFNFVTSLEGRPDDAVGLKRPATSGGAKPK